MESDIAARKTWMRGTEPAHDGYKRAGAALVAAARKAHALMIASEGGHADIVKTLLISGADRDLRNKKRETAIDIAVASGHTEIAQMLK